MAKAKEIEGLDCGAGAAAGVRLVLVTRLEEMCAYRAAALDWTSDEGVHDMRVASRRLRSVLRDFRPHMRAGRRLDAAREELRRLARVLGTARDEDVAIGALDELKREAPEAFAAGLELFADDRRARREGARVELARALAEESFESSRSRVAFAFEKATAPRGGKRGAGDEADEAGPGEMNEDGPSFRDVGRQVIVRSWDELRSRGADIYRPLKSRRLHRLRIASKRLRYALELFAACYGEALKGLARELAQLQTALGELHDCDEWVEEFGQYLSASKGADDSRRADAGELAALRREAAFALLEHFASKRAEHYAEALGIWRGWERDDFGSRLADRLNETQKSEG
ncbi:MAG TPA: CHAD domain-containing protein [Pyrinomonadaceae bacterium]|nr:CHAD domain-containing protein [Pyrinomonadaceae bacterium]